MEQLSLKITNSLSELDKLHKFVEELGVRFDIAEMLVNSINLALEEAVVNIIDYAYPEGETGSISLTVENKEHTLIFTLTDYGKPFDPTAVADVDTSLPLEEREVGGLGVFLIRNIMDTLSYQRCQSANRLTMTLHLA
jgi:serine/threonine-protein kinase RsbW